MAGTVTHTIRQDSSGSIARHEIAWVADGSGGVAEPYTSGELKRIQGTILRIIEVPDTGDTKPTDSFDVTFEDEAGVDLLGGQGTDVDADAPVDIVPGIPFTDGTTTSVAPVTVNDTPSLTVAGAGDSNGGKIIVYTR